MQSKCTLGLNSKNTMLLCLEIKLVVGFSCIKQLHANYCSSNSYSYRLLWVRTNEAMNVAS